MFGYIEMILELDSPFPILWVKRGKKKTRVFHKIFVKIIKIIIKKINHSRFNFSIEFELLMIKRNHHLSFASCHMIYTLIVFLP